MLNRLIVVISQIYRHIKPLFCIRDTNTVLYVNYISIKWEKTQTPKGGIFSLKKRRRIWHLSSKWLTCSQEGSQLKVKRPQTQSSPTMMSCGTWEKPPDLCLSGLIQKQENGALCACKTEVPDQLKSFLSFSKGA